MGADKDVKTPNARKTGFDVGAKGHDKVTGQWSHKRKRMTQGLVRGNRKPAPNPEDRPRVTTYLISSM